MAIQCLVIVNGYTEGKSDDNRGRFHQSFQALPNVGDTVLLEADGSWGKTWCVIERRYHLNNIVILGARIANKEDFKAATEKYGLHLEIL